MLGQAGHASQRVRDRQLREIDDVDAAHARYRLPDQIVVDLFRLAGSSDERNVARIGQERRCGPHCAFHIEAGRENREAWRRLQVTHAALVHPANDHGRTRPEFVTRAKNELKCLGKRCDDHVEVLIPVLRAEAGPEPALFDVRRGEACDVHVLHLDADSEGPLREQDGADAGGDGRRGRQARLAGKQDEDGRLSRRGLCGAGPCAEEQSRQERGAQKHPCSHRRDYSRARRRPSYGEVVIRRVVLAAREVGLLQGVR